jgi:DNA polymerase III delta prime subunit
MGVVPDEVIKEVDAKIVSLGKEIGDLATEYKSATDEKRKKELIDKITEKEKDLRAARQKKGQYKAVLAHPSKHW